jgi:hypothetical protein
VPHPARDTTGRPNGVRSRRRSAGSSSPVIGLPGEEHRGLAQDLALLPQIPDLTTQPPSSSRSPVLRPSLRRPASRSAGLTHSRTAVSVKSSSLATCPTVLPVVRINSTTSALDSDGKNRRGRDTWTPHSRARPSSWVSTRPGQLQLGRNGIEATRCKTVAMRGLVAGGLLAGSLSIIVHGIGRTAPPVHCCPRTITGRA